MILTSAVLGRLLRETYEPERLTAASRFDEVADGDTVFEVRHAYA